MIRISFDNLEEIRRAYDPVVVEKATFSTVRKLHQQAATQISKGVRKVHRIKAGAISKALTKRVRKQGEIPVGLLLYTGRRLSRRHFSTHKGGGAPSGGPRPKVKSARGVRYGAKAPIRKDESRKIIRGAFWGRGRAGSIDTAGEWQIFQRIGAKRLKVRKLTGPSIAHMMRSSEAQEAVNTILAGKSEKILANELDHFAQRYAGIR